MSTEQTLRFTEMMAAWRNAFRRLFVLYLAYKDREARWKLAYAQVFFQPDPLPKQDVTLDVRTTRLAAGRRVLPLASEAALCLVQKALSSGALVVGEDTYPLCVDTNERCSDYFYAAAPPGQASTNARLPTLVLSSSASNNMRSDVHIDDVEDELRTLVTPFDGLDDLLRTIGASPDVSLNDSRRIEIRLNVPTDVMIAESSVADGYAHIRIGAAPTIDKNSVRLGLRIPTSADESARFTIAGNELMWSEKDEWLRGEFRRNVGDAKYLQCFVSYAGLNVSRWWLTDRTKQLNHRATVHRAIDPEDKRIRKLLFPPKTEARDLERGIALILGIYGFNVRHYGDKDVIQEGPDLVAETPTNKMLVIECAVEVSDLSGKLTKLRQRTARILEALQRDHFSNVEVLPTFVVGMSRSEVGSQREAFEKDQIALVTKENLEELLQRLGLPQNADAIFNEAKRLVPHSNPLFQTGAVGSLFPS